MAPVSSVPEQPRRGDTPAAATSADALRDESVRIRTDGGNRRTALRRDADVAARTAVTAVTAETHDTVEASAVAAESTDALRQNAVRTGTGREHGAAAAERELHVLAGLGLRAGAAASIKEAEASAAVAAAAADALGENAECVVAVGEDVAV